MRLEVQVNLSPQIAHPLICHSVISICCSGFSSFSSIDEFRELIVSENTLAVAEDPEDDIRRSIYFFYQSKLNDSFLQRTKDSSFISFSS